MTPSLVRLVVAVQVRAWRHRRAMRLDTEQLWERTEKDANAG